MDCSKLGCNYWNKRVQLVQIRTGFWGVELPNQGGYYEATSHPPLWSVTWTATLSEWKSKRSQKLSKKMSKCANFTITAAKMKPALCRQYHHLSAPSKTAWYQKRKKHKTDILHPEHLVCCLNLWRSLRNPENDLFGDEPCLLTMIEVARLTGHKPKISAENVTTDRKLFVWRFLLIFLREIWLLTYMRIRWNVARVSMREEVKRCTCTWWRSWSRCASECGRWWRSGRDGGTWDCRKNSERPKQRFEVWKSFGRICRRFGRIWIGRVVASETFEDNSIYFESA